MKRVLDIEKEEDKATFALEFLLYCKLYSLDVDQTRLLCVKYLEARKEADVAQIRFSVPTLVQAAQKWAKGN